MNCWRSEVRGSWDDYVKNIGSRNRRRKVRDLKKKYIDTGRADFSYAKTQAEFNDYFEMLVDLHQRRRQSLGEPGCFAAPEFSGLLKEVSQKFFDNKKLLLSQLKVDGEPACNEYRIRGREDSLHVPNGHGPQSRCSQSRLAHEHFQHSCGLRNGAYRRGLLAWR